jgi:hypothetical protein
MRPDVVSVPDVLGPLGLNVIDMEPPSGHGIVNVGDMPFEETIIEELTVAWVTAAVTMC